MDRTIHVAYVSDNNYTVFTCVSMASMLANTKSHVHFHVVSNRLSDENKNYMIQLGNRFQNGSWSFYGFDYDISFMKTTNHLTAETYYRIYLPLILPDLDRVIYIDGDTVVNGDIAELWDMDLGGKAAGIIPHCFALYDILLHKEVLELGPSRPYCNCGVLLLDLARFKELGIHQNLERLIDEVYAKFKNFPQKVPFYADQEILNYVFAKTDAVKYLSYKFNSMLKSVKPTCDEAGLGLAELKEAYFNPVIVHYGGATKVWALGNQLCTVENDFIKLYYQYKKSTAFYDSTEDLRMERYLERYDWTMKHALISYGLYLDLFEREILRCSAKRVKHLKTDRQIVYYGAGNRLRPVMIHFAGQGILPHMIVDSSPKVQGSHVYDYCVQSPDEIAASPETYFVIVAIEDPDMAREIKKSLLSWGYTEETVYHAFQPAIDRMNEDIL